MKRSHLVKVAMQNQKMVKNQGLLVSSRLNSWNLVSVNRPQTKRRQNQTSRNRKLGSAILLLYYRMPSEQVGHILLRVKVLRGENHTLQPLQEHL